MNRLTAKLVNPLITKVMNCLATKLVDCLTAKLVVVNLVKLHLIKSNIPKIAPENAKIWPKSLCKMFFTCYPMYNPMEIW